MRKKRSRLIKSYTLIIAVGIALIAVVAVLSLRFVGNVRNDLWSSSVNTIIESTSQASNLVTGRIDAEKNALSMQTCSLKKLNSTDKNTIEFLLSEFSSFESPEYLVLGEASYPANAVLKTKGLSDFANNELRIIPPYLSNINGKRVLSLFTEVMFADGVKGYLAKEISVNKINNAFSVAFFQNQGRTYLINKSGDILFRTATHKGNKTSKNLFVLLSNEAGNNRAVVSQTAQLVANGESGWSILNYKNEKNVYCFVPIDSTDWYMVSVVPKTVVDMQTDSIIHETFLLVAIIFLGFILLIGLLVYREHQNIRKMQAENILERKMIFASATEINNLLLGVNLADDTYTVIINSEDKDFDFGEYPKFSDLIRERARMLEPEYRDEFLTRFAAEHLLHLYGEGQRSEYLEVRTSDKGVMHWLAVEMVHVDTEDGIPRAVYSTKIIDEAKEKEENRRFVLKNALDLAEHANRAKTTFLNNISHDIRTPMNAIIGFTALAVARLDDREAVQNYLSKIHVSSQHLLSLINDVLDMSRIESGKVKIEENEIHLPDVLKDLRTIIHSSIKAKQLELYIDTQDVEHENIITDKLRLNQVLLNILGNAVKFTYVGGTISIRVIEKPCTNKDYCNYEFRIKDTGIGMSEEFIKHIFESFTREKNAMVKGIQGTGLGMAITKNIVDMMGGTITVNSEIDKGSEFIVNFQFKLSDKQVVYENPPELQGARALIADDDINTCTSVTKMLLNIGMRSDWTTSGKEAVFRAEFAVEQNDEFSVYIIDWLMPDMNGIEVVRRIRSIIGDSKPIIILTAYDWSDIEVEAKEAGVTAFCSKPIFMSELREILFSPFVKQEQKEEKKISFAGKRILLAEDNEMNQEIAVTILEAEGCMVDVAENGIEAVEKLQSSEAGHYDLILMDIQMPQMDGYEATEAIRALADTAKNSIPIIAMTADAFHEAKKKAMDVGMNGHIAKPIDIKELFEVLDEHLKSD